MTGRGGQRTVVTLRDIPRGPGALDDDVTVVVHLPPGSGPRADPADGPAQLGARSAPAYRLLLNLAFLWHVPGRTHAPVGNGRARRWRRSYDPSRYFVIDDDEAVRLTYPASVKRNRREFAARARDIIKRLEAASELQVIEADPGSRRPVGFLHFRLWVRACG